MNKFINYIFCLLLFYACSAPARLDHVEKSGGSDGTELQKIPYPIDWCFVGAAEDFVHSPNEKVHKKDIESMLEAYKTLMKELGV